MTDIVTHTVLEPRCEPQHDLSRELEELESEEGEFDLENMYNGRGGARGNQGNQMRWSIQNINKFHGRKGEDPDHHISELEDVLRASGNFPADVEE